MNQYIIFIIIGIAAGVVAGSLGLAGGIVVIPALIYFAGFSQKLATGTYLFLMMFPLSIGAALENYKNSNVNIKAVFTIGITMLIFAYIFAKLTNNINQNYLKIGFAVFIILMGIYMIFTSISELK